MELEMIRGIENMKQKNNVKLRCASRDIQNNKPKEGIWGKIVIPIFTNIVPSVILALGVLILFYVKLPMELNVIKDQLNDINEDVHELRNENDLVERELNARIDELYRQLLAMSGTFIMQPTVEAQNLITYMYQNLESNFENNALQASTLVAYDKKTGQQYTAAEVANKKLLLPYKNDSQEVFFYGQFNENGQWEGPCVINVYTGGKLEIITEATYNDGILLASKQAFHYTADRSKQEVWAVADRVRETDSNGNKSEFMKGVTRLYIKENEYDQAFDFDDVSEQNIIGVDEFESAINSKVYATYYGNTCDGYFNDNTGNAYMVYYFEDGAVRLLYVGNFKNGTFNDSTGNAWQILREENTTYMYYKGRFKNGREDHSASYEFENYLTDKRIDEIMADNHFKPYDDLKWSNPMSDI